MDGLGSKTCSSGFGFGFEANNDLNQLRNRIIAYIMVSNICLQRSKMSFWRDRHSSHKVSINCEKIRELMSVVELGTNNIVRVERIGRKIEYYIEKCLNENKIVPPISKIYWELYPNHA